MSGKYIVRLRDYFQAAPTEEYRSLGVREKVRLMDSALQKGNVQKGLAIQLRISTSGRRINNRIYTPTGHKAGLNSWLNPFPKPVIKNHDSSLDPLGRISNVEWRATPMVNTGFFRDSYGANEINSALSSGDPVRIYEALEKHRLLFNKEWPGVGGVFGVANITDEAAVERFLDGRYLTFSAGQKTNSYSCGLCGNDWVLGDICDHRPGVIEDGKVCVFVAGDLEGEEISVVNDPADSLSQVSGIEVIDSSEEFGSKMTSALHDFDRIDESTIYLTDYKIEPEKKKISPKSILDHDVVDLDVKDIVKGVFAGDYRFEDASLRGSSHLEVSWLVRMHDALHSNYDWELRSEDGMASASLGTMPNDVYRLHGALHDISVKRDFRGSLINGPLDNYDSKGSETGAYLMKTRDQESTETPSKSLTLEDVLAALKDLGIKFPEGDAEVEEETQELTDTSEEVADQKEEAEVTDAELKPKPDEDDFEIPWWFVDASTPSEEDISKAESLLENTSLSDAVRQLITDAIAATKAASTEDKPECKCETCECGKLSDVNKDWASALALLETEKNSTKNLADALEQALEVCAKIQDKDLVELVTLEDKVTWLNEVQTNLKDTISESEETIPTDVPKVDNPSVSGGEYATVLSDYQRTIVTRYKTILDEKGQFAASRFLNGKKAKGYLPSDFDLSSTLEE